MTLIPPGSSSESSNPACVNSEKNDAANTVRASSTRTPLDARHNERLPTHRRKAAPDRGRFGWMSSAATTAAKTPRIASAGSNSSPAPGSGKGIVGAAATGRPPNSDDPETATRIMRRCPGIASPVTDADFPGASPAKLWPLEDRAGQSSRLSRWRWSRRPRGGSPASRRRTDV